MAREGLSRRRHAATTELLRTRIEAFLQLCYQAAGTSGPLFVARVLPSWLGRWQEPKAAA